MIGGAPFSKVQVSQDQTMSNCVFGSNFAVLHFGQPFYFRHAALIRILSMTEQPSEDISLTEKDDAKPCDLDYEIKSALTVFVTINYIIKKNIYIRNWLFSQRPFRVLLMESVRYLQV